MRPCHNRATPCGRLVLSSPYNHSTLPGRRKTPAPPIYVDNEEEWEISEILDSKIIRGKLHYFVDWKGYGPEERSWEPAENMTHASEALDNFHQEHPDKPRGRSGERP